jgi:hypothetical protein
MQQGQQTIPGIESVLAWFGRWPSFHDAEILSVHLNRDGTSTIRIHTWNPTSKVDSEGRFIREREAVVVFEFARIGWLKLDGEDADRQNVIAGLTLEAAPAGYRLHLSPCYGLAGEIVAERMAVRIEQRQA